MLFTRIHRYSWLPFGLYAFAHKFGCHVTHCGLITTWPYQCYLFGLCAFAHRTRASRTTKKMGGHVTLCMKFLLCSWPCNKWPAQEKIANGVHMHIEIHGSSYSGSEHGMRHMARGRGWGWGTIWGSLHVFTLGVQQRPQCLLAHAHDTLPHSDFVSQSGREFHQ